MRKLNREQRARVEAAYQEAMRADGNPLLNGSHAILIMVLTMQKD